MVRLRGSASARGDALYVVVDARLVDPSTPTTDDVEALTAAMVLLAKHLAPVFDDPLDTWDALLSVAAVTAALQGVPVDLFLARAKRRLLPAGSLRPLPDGMLAEDLKDPLLGVKR